MLVEVSLGAGREDACAPVPWGCQLMGDFPVSVFSVCWRGDRRKCRCCPGSSELVKYHLSGAS